MALHDTNSHEACKQFYGVRGYPDWECVCICHKDSAKVRGEGQAKDIIGLGRAEVTKGV